MTTPKEPDFRFEPLMRVLAERFKRHEMRVHLELLRAFYAVHRQQQREAAKSGAWGGDEVCAWLSILRIPPFEHVYPVLGRGAHCPGCRADQAGRQAKTLAQEFPGGRLRKCWSCDARWLELEPTTSAPHSRNEGPVEL